MEINHISKSGSLVTKDTPGGKLIMGHPARIDRDVSEEELLKDDL